MIAITFFSSLVTTAELHNTFSIIALIFLFCGMILLITRSTMLLRVHDTGVEMPTSVHNIVPRVPQMNMVKVHIPFTFKLSPLSNLPYDEYQCVLSSQVNYFIRIYWGVNIKKLHIFLWRPWAEIRNACLNGNVLQGYYKFTELKMSKTPHPDLSEILKLPSASLDLGPPPRLCYPLVIFLFRSDFNDDIPPNETVALINVLHIKDKVCTLPTRILAQYLKQANGQLSCLKQLYMATGIHEDNIITESPSINEDLGPRKRTIVCPMSEDSTGEQLCSVCHYFPLSRALLPCRHTCVCGCCFDKLDKCPICRGPIKSYFCIRGEEYMPFSNSEKINNNTLYNWLDSWNDRLTDFLGFQR